jgi:branched-subunit amino acid ABC-type transport system permease component
VALMVLFGVAYQRTVIRAILPRHVRLIAALATSIVLTNLAIIVFGAAQGGADGAVITRPRRGRLTRGLAAPGGRPPAC